MNDNGDVVFLLTTMNIYMTKENNKRVIRMPWKG